MDAKEAGCCSAGTEKSCGLNFQYQRGCNLHIFLTNSHNLDHRKEVLLLKAVFIM